MTANANNIAGDWAEAWPDALAFVSGLALAWFGRWETRDLVWSLWLSSLLVGYAMILWMIFSPGVYVGWCAWRDRSTGLGLSPGKVAALGGVYLFGALFMLAFFTVHF